MVGGKCKCKKTVIGGDDHDNERELGMLKVVAGDNNLDRLQKGTASVANYVYKRRLITIATTTLEIRDTNFLLSALTEHQPSKKACQRED